jgi:hypothetical protein|nr:MAG TPA: Neck appendage protein [Caudoviricetes sp.]
MYSEVSEEFVNTIRSPSRTFNARLKINGKWYSTGLKKMTYENSSSSEESLQLGSAVSAKIELTVAKIDELFENTEISVEIGLKLQGGAYEYVPVGIFTAEHPTNDENSTTFTAYDRMIKTTGIYISDLSYPAKAKDVLNEISVQCGVLIDTSGIDVVIEKRPEGYTCREMIGYIASLVGGFACVNRIGTIIIKWYEQTDFKLDLSRIMTFEKTESNYHLDYLTANIDNSNSYTAGGGTLGVTFDNPFMTSSGLEDVYNKIKGFTYREVELKAPADIRLDVWDIITAAVNGVEYSVPVMNIVYEYDGGMSMTVKSFGKTEVETSTDFKGPTSKAVERMYSELITTKELVAKKVDAEWVKANTVTSEKVISIEADILSIKNNYLQTSEADIKYATIEKLDGVEGKFEDFYAKDFESAVSKIEDLTVGVEKVNTIMFGSASGGSLTTEFSNSIVSLIGDAQIKSAMIKDVSADKITSGKIYTNLVEILSGNGNLDILDNTIQIKDNNKIVRVQIGKDTSNDYNMYVWDKSGNLMFDAIGLTDKGIQREIIRNDMVSQDANISAKKLDINSLFDVINNDGSHTLKSSKIYVDSDNQTLDVAFKQVTTNVESVLSDIGTIKKNINTVIDTISTQGTQITAIQGQISSKVWQQDITTAVNNLQVGGRNLLLNTAGNNSFEHWYTYKASNLVVVKDSERISGNALKFTSTGGGLFQRKGGKADGSGGTYVAGTTVTISGYIKSNKAKAGFTVSCEHGGDGTTKAVSTPLENTWYYFSFTMTPSKNWVTMTFYGWNGVDYYLGDLKLEYGEKATTWTPAPEDIDSSISTVEEKVTIVSNQYTSLNQSLTSLTATVNSNTTKISEKADGSTVTALQANMTALTADLSGFKTTVSQTYTSKTEFNNLQIGGRNLLLNTADLTKWHKEASITVTKDSNDYFKISTTNTSSWWSAYWYISSDKSEQTYTLSGYNKKGTKTGHVVVRYYKSGANNILLQKDVSEGYFTIKFTVPSGAETITVYLGLSPTASGDYTYFKLPKLELGDKATDWSPAPEDTDEKFTEYSTTTQMNSAINQSANSVLTTVSSNYATKASLEVKIDKDKLISEINASADIIALKSNRFVLDSTNAKIAADGTVNFVQGTIGGWNISSTKLSGAAGLQGISINKPSSTSTKVISINHIDTTAATYVDDFYVRADGYTYIPDGYLSTRNNTVGGKGIEISGSMIKFFSWTDKDNFAGGVWSSYVDTGDSGGAQAKRQSLIVASDFNDELHLSYGNPDGKTYTAAVIIDKNHDNKVHMIKPTVFHSEIQSANSNLICNTDFSVGKKGTEKIARFWCYNGGSDTKSVRIFNSGGESGKYLTNCELSLWGTGAVQYNWSVNGTIYGNISSDSDRNIKKDIKALDIENSAQFIYSLIPSEFRFKNGTSNRLHHGLIAQEVKESMKGDWGVFIDKAVDDKNYNAIAVDDLTGEQTQLLTARYGLRYDELIADLIATVQSLNNRLKALEK